MKTEQLRTIIENAFENIEEVSPETKGEIREAVEETLNALDKGRLRIAEKTGAPDNYGWVVHQWLKKAILL